jgi:thiosulfate reductase cytochrome b subunit
MSSTYRFKFDTEPTDNDLNSLMKDVLIEVKSRAKSAEQKFKKLQKLQIEAAIKRQKKLLYGTD